MSARHRIIQRNSTTVLDEIYSSTVPSYSSGFKAETIRRIRLAGSLNRFSSGRRGWNMTKRLEWYLVRTKSSKERWVCDQLSGKIPEAFLPLLEARTSHWGRPAWSILPLFPCYVFARFDLEAQYFDVRYLPGIQGIVSAGRDPLVVPIAVVDEIKRRGVDGIVRIQAKPFDPGERVRVAEGPFRGFEAVFERYLSGAERVALLLRTVEYSGVRVVLPSSAITRSA
jgi:transcriptional antiterminator RfaH